MKRRDFCRATLSAGFVAGYPFLAGCGNETPVAVAPPKAETGIAAISLNGVEIELEKAAVNELGGELAGRLILSGHPEYDTVRKVWNP